MTPLTPKPYVSFTLVTNTEGLLTKRATLVDDVLSKEGKTELAHGVFQTEKVLWSEFGDYLEGIKPECAIVLGHAVDKRPSGEIITKAAYESGSRGDSGSAIPRSTGTFGFLELEPDTAQLLYLDFDDIDQGLVAGLDISDAVSKVFNRFLEICPAFKAFSFWIRPSSGAYIWDKRSQKYVGNHGKVGGLTGLHAFFKVDLLGAGKASADLIKEYIRTQAYLAGFGVGFHFKLAEGDMASLLKRYPVDLVVLSASRLCYAAGVFCEPTGPFEQHNRVAFEWVAETAGSGISAFQLDDSEHQKGRSKLSAAADAYKLSIGWEALQEARDVAAAARKSVHISVIKQRRGLLESGKLSGMHDVLMDDGSWVRAWRFCVYGSTFHRKTCRDPLEPEYCNGAPNKAVVFSNDGRARIESLAHGDQSFKVILDLETVMEILDTVGGGRGDLGRDELEKELGPDWITIFRDLTPVEQATIFEKVKKMGWFSSKGAAKEQFVAAMEKVEGKRMKADLKAALLELNNHYAELELGSGGEIRILRMVPTLLDDSSSGAESRYGHQEIKHFKQAQNKRFRVWRDGKEKTVILADEWLAWEGRRRYCKVAYRPDRSEREMAVQFNGGEARALNIFDGFSVEADPSKPEGCSCTQTGESSNCIVCFFGHLNYKVCPAHAKVGITGWLQHIHDCVSKGVVEDTRWIVDWFCDIVQRPGRGLENGKALAVYGPGYGTGKTTLVEPLKKILGERTNCFTTSNTDNLIGRFNSSVEGRLLIHAEEALWREGRNATSNLKNLITGGNLAIERKGLDIYQIENFIRMFVSSNELRAVPVLPGERRFACFEINEAHIGDRNWFGRYVGEAAQAEYGRWLSDMLMWEIKSDLNIVPDTDGLFEQKMLGLNSTPDLAFFAYCLENEVFWDEEGIPKWVTTHELKELAQEQGYGLGEHYRSFAMTFWAKVSNLGIKKEEGKNLRQGKVFATPIRLSHTLEDCHKFWDNKMRQNTQKKVIRNVWEP